MSLTKWAAYLIIARKKLDDLAGLLHRAGLAIHFSQGEFLLQSAGGTALDTVRDPVRHWAYTERLLISNTLMLAFVTIHLP